MCGISGIIGQSSRELGEQLLAKISHRGPDGSAVWVSPSSEHPVTMCHTRLAVHDTSSAASQPFHSQDGRYVLIYNGEIYNFLELKAYIESKGFHFYSSSDTEVLLLGLILEGPAFLEKCNGMWAFCFWDRLTATAIFSRDRFGVKPLFYSILDSGELAFSSEMKGLAPLLGTIQPDSSIKEFIDNLFIYESTTSCPVLGVNRFLSGTIYSYCNNLFSELEWWNTLDHISPISDPYVHQVSYWKELFLDSVKIRLRSDVSVGSALSGGLDSSSIVAAISYVNDHNLDTKSSLAHYTNNSYCSSFGDSFNDESEWADYAAKSARCNLSKIFINPSKSHWNILDGLAQVEDPYITLPIPMLDTYARMSKDGVKVTLDGHGGDELLSGYTGDPLRAITSKLNAQEITEILAIDESSRSGVYSPKERLRKRDLAYTLVKNSLYSLRPSPRWYSHSDVVVEIRKKKARLASHPIFQAMDPFTKVLYEHHSLTTLPTLLRNYDRYSSASGVEIRMPFMDHRLITYTFSLPWRSKLGDGYTKKILRDSMSGILDDKLRFRRSKIGWNAPLHDWFRGPLREQMDEIINNQQPDLISASWNSVRRSWTSFQGLRNPNFNDGQRLWSNIGIALWEMSLRSSIWC